jgi:hypothetical protein
MIVTKTPFAIAMRLSAGFSRTICHANHGFPILGVLLLIPKQKAGIMKSARPVSWEDRSVSEKRARWGNFLIRFCGYALMLSSAVKFIQPPKALAYMASMGFEGGTFFLVAVLELLSAALLLLPTTRWIGLLLVSSYMGGAIAAHLAVHRFLTGGPFLVYMATHRYVGSRVPSIVLAAGWIGTWLSHPAELASLGHTTQLRGQQSLRAGREIAISSAR